jgi:PAB1-binding protein PBP1
MSVIHIAEFKGEMSWRIEASPKKKMNEMIKEANKLLKEKGITDPEWDIRTIGDKTPVVSAETVEAESTFSAAPTPAQKRKKIR